jgi:hypothetical protein
MSVVVPATVAGLVVVDVLAAVEAALAPPPEQRATVAFEVEIEVVGEGTFTLRHDAGRLSGKKGFAKAALLSMKVGKGAWPLLRDELQAAVDGFPQAPALLRSLRSFHEVAKPAVLDGVVAAVKKIPEGLAIHFDVKGEGVITVARGPVDEATKELKVGLVGAQLRGLLAGAPLSTLTTTTSGERTIGATVISALGPLYPALMAQR